MKFKIKSVYFTDLTNAGADEYIKLMTSAVTEIVPVNNELPEFYIEVTTIEELQGIVEKISNSYTETGLADEEGLWNIIIDFDTMLISIYDDYIE